MESVALAVDAVGHLIAAQLFNQTFAFFTRLVDGVVDRDGAVGLLCVRSARGGSGEAVSVHDCVIVLRC